MPLSKAQVTAPVPEVPELDRVTRLAHGVEVALGTTLMLCVEAAVNTTSTSLEVAAS